MWIALGVGIFILTTSLMLMFIKRPHSREYDADFPMIFKD